MKKGSIGILGLTMGALGGAISAGKVLGDKVNSMHQMSDKHLTLFIMMNQWVKIKQEGKNLASYFEKNNYKRIAIYGMSYVGETLVDELKNSGVRIEYGIDQRADAIYSDIDVVTTKEKLEDVDVIVVTAITYFDDIEAELSNKVSCPIVSLEDILYEI